jgi:hypothetical protein
MGKREAKSVTNYRGLIRYKNGNFDDGLGWAPNQKEAKERFLRVVKKTKNIESTELYFEGKLIAKS